MSTTFHWDQSISPRATHRGPEPEGSLGLDDLPLLRVEPTGERNALVRTRTLGQGGMGIVSLVHDGVLDRDVAMKEVRYERADAVAALLHEARMMGSLEHPNIIPVHALAAVNGSPALVMKRVEGANWEELLDDPAHPGWAVWDGSTDPLERNVEILQDVCRALAYAHARGVVHRDVKPENVMLGAQGEVYLLDFGVAARSGTVTTSAAGTPAYMAPEMVQPGAVDAAMDVFLVGATLTRVLTGGPRHQGADLDAVLQAVRACAPTSFSGVDPALAVLANSCCAAKPHARPQGVGEVLKSLRQWREDRQSHVLMRAAEEQFARFRALAVDEETQAAGLRSFSAAHFGFQTVLERSPSHPRAVARLVELLEAGIRVAVAREADLHSAGYWCEELAELSPERAAHWHPRIEAAQSALDRHRQAEVALDMTVGEGRRAIFAMTVFLLGAACTLLAVTGVIDTSRHDNALGLAGLFSATFILATGWSYLRMEHTRATMLLLRGMLMMVAALLLNRTASWWHGIPIFYMFAVDLMVLALCGFVAGAFFPGRLIGFGMVCSVGMLTILLFPASHVWAFGITTTLAPLMFTRPIWQSLWNRLAAR